MTGVANSPLFIFMSRIATFVGAILAPLAVFVITSISGQLNDLRTTASRAATQVEIFTANIDSLRGDVKTLQMQMDAIRIGTVDKYSGSDAKRDWTANDQRLRDLETRITRIEERRQ